MTFILKTKPFERQLYALKRSWDKPYHALFMRQGTGKTKVTYDTAVNLYLLKKKVITGMVVLSDKGWYRLWITDELPIHWPASRVPVKTYLWDAGESKTKRDMPRQESFLAPNADGISLLVMNIDAIITSRGRDFVKRFLQSRPCLMVIDESSSIASPSAKRSRAAWTLGKLAPYRRILNGTPVEQGPLKLYGQTRFLSQRIFGTSVFSFKHEYAEWELRKFKGQRRAIEVLAKDERGRPKYKNLAQLNAVLSDCATFVSKEECFDLPPKLFQKVEFDLTSIQRSIYDKLREEYLLELPEGDDVPVTMVLTRMLRLQQLTSGFRPAEDIGEIVWLDPQDNPRLETLRETIEKFPEGTPMVIWSRFRPDIDKIIGVTEQFGSTVRYDGKVKAEERERNKQDYQNGRAQFLVGNVHVGGKGSTWTNTEVMVFYANDFSSEWRVQAEDRAHRFGLKHSVLYIDLMARDTVDEKIVRTHRINKEIATLITGRNAKDWL